MIIFQVTVVIYLPPFVISICVETFPRIDSVHNVEYISRYDKALVLFLYDILVYHRGSIVPSVIRMHGEGRTVFVRLSRLTKKVPR